MNDLKELQSYHQLLRNEMISFFDKNSSLITRTEDLKIYDYLKEYSLRGKLIRGSLIILINDVLTGKVNDDALITATSLEVLHSSILVIDDIIDKDDVRRGKPSIHVIVKELIPDSKDLDHDAQSIAQCVGLIGTYSAYMNLSRVNKDVTKQLSEEFVKTGFAELNEIILSQKEIVTNDDVMNIYKFKTAKYTITLPFKLAYILSGESFTEDLEKITDNIGILFQFTDDLLELDRSAEEIGKSNTSDIKAGKQHYPRKVLEISVSDEDLLLLNQYYSDLSDESVVKIKELYEKYDVADKTRKVINNLKEETVELIKEQDPRIRFLLEKLLNYVIERKF